MMTKTYLDRMPEAVLPEYDDSNEDTAIILFHFNSLRDEIPAPDPYFQVSLCTAYSLIRNTDIVDRKIPIYFFVEDSLMDNYQTLIYGNVRPDRIIPFGSKPSIVKKRRISQTFYIFESEPLKRYNHLVKWDVDLFACRPENSNKKLDMGFLNTDTIATMEYSYQFYGDKGQKSWFDRWIKEPLEGSSEEDVWDFNVNQTLSAIKSLRPDFRVPTSYSQFHAAMASIPQSLPEDQKQFLLDIEPAVGADELGIALWENQFDERAEMLKHSCYVYGEVDDFTNKKPWIGNEPYCVHIMFDGNVDDTEWENMLYRDMGLK